MTHRAIFQRPESTSLLLALIFGVPGSMKLLGHSYEVEHFRAWGFPAYAVTLIGAAELAGAVGLLIRPLSALAASGLFLVMMGAVGTYAVHGQWLKVWLPVTLMALCAHLARGHLRPWRRRRIQSI